MVQTDEERKAKKKDYNKKYHIENKAKFEIIRQDIRLNILQTYSKRLSKSNIPCCNCCKLNTHLDFLALDHIVGKKEMDSIPELVAIGYSSKMQSASLHRWIIDNNYLSDLKTEYFQVLCNNCNHAKGHSKYNKCPHERK